MKKILVSMFAVAALAACSTEHTVVAPQGEAIGFDTFVENTTRANDVDINSIKNFGFGVYASVTNGTGQSGLILENEAVTYNGNWGYANTQYWVVGNDYNFTAFAPKADAQWAYQPTGTTAHNGVISFNNRDAAANQDLVFAYAERSVDEPLTAAPDKVGFTFNHMLSRVRFTFANGFQSAGNIELAVSNVHIIDAYANGTLVVADGKPAAKWTPADKNLDVVFGDAAATILEGKKQSTEHFYLIPNSEATTYAVTFDVTLFQAGVEIDTYSHTVEFTYAMNRGMSYDIKTTLNPQNTSDEEGEIYPIEFTVDAVNDWAEYKEVETEGLTEVKDEAELKAAIAAGKNVKLTADVVLTKPVEITKNAIVNLNGNDIAVNVFTESNGTISAGNTDSFAFWVKDGGDLTITGEGTVSTMPCKYSIAVWAQGGKVTINGGTFKNAGEGSDLIYASANGHIVINGGEFVACEKKAGVDGTQEAYSVLNLKGDGTGSSITCYGGRYFKFDPANNKSENPAVSFVAPGYKSVVDGDYYKVVKM